MIKNLTHRDLFINGQLLKASGVICRIEKKYSVINNDEGYPLKEQRLEGIQNLPEPCEGVMLIVPYTVAQACRGTRSDLCYADYITKHNDYDYVRHLTRCI